MALVIAAVLVMALANFFITFNGPPPRAAPVQMARVIELAQTGSQTRGAARLRLALSRQGPIARKGQNAVPGMTAALAKQMAVPVSSVRFFMGPGRPPVSASGAPLAVREDFTFGLYSGGQWRVVTPQPEPLFTSWHLTTLALTMMIAIILAIAGWWFSRAIVLPLESLADEADRVNVRYGSIRVDSSAPPEIVRLANAFDRMRARYASSVASRTDLLVGIAHDLGTPLTRLAFRAQQLPRATRDAASADIEEMRALIAATMDFARSSRGQKSRVALHDVVDKRIERLTRDDAPFSITQIEPVFLHGNELALGRMISNILENAQRYGEGAEVALIVEGRMAKLTIADRGLGFDPEITGQLFEPFFREERSRNRFTGGTGLGLAIARDIVEQHGGQINAVNREGGGSIFTVTLPVNDEPYI